MGEFVSQNLEKIDKELINRTLEVLSDLLKWDLDTTIDHSGGGRFKARRAWAATILAWTEDLVAQNLLSARLKVKYHDLLVVEHSFKDDQARRKNIRELINAYDLFTNEVIGYLRQNYAGI